MSNNNNYAWEVVALNKLYSNSQEGGFEELDQIFLAERIDFIQAKNHIITFYEKLGHKLSQALSQEVFSSPSRQKLKQIEEAILNTSVFQTKQTHLEIILEVCNLLSRKEIADCMKDLFEVLDQVKSRTSSRFFISKDFAYVDILIFSALRRCRAWKKVSKGAKDTIPHLFSWHEWIKNEHKKGLFKEKMEGGNEAEHSQAQQEYFEALKVNNLPEVQRFLLDSIPIECFDLKDKKKTACHIACETGNLELLRFLIEKHKCNIEARDCEEMTPLFYALESKNLQIIKYLVEKGANLEQNDFVRQTPFYYACYASSVEAVRYLYAKGCDIDSLYSSKRSPLNKAADMGRKDVVEFLVSSCSDIKINETGKRGRTALQMSVWAKPERIGRPDAVDYPEIAEFLLQNGAQVNQKDHEGYTAIMTAAATGAIKSIPVLIKFGAIVDCLNNSNETPLYKASERGHVEVCQLLVEEYRADPFLKSKANLDCIEVSIINQRFNVTRYFLENLKVVDSGDNFNRFLKLILCNYKTRIEMLNLIEIFCRRGAVFEDPETLERLTELQDESLLEILTNMMGNKKLLMDICLRIRWIQGIKILLGKFHNEKTEHSEWNIFSINLDLDFEEFKYILTNLNIDIFQTNSATHETILHLLVKQKSVRVLSHICNFLKNHGECYSSCLNIYLKNANLETIKSFLNAKNNESCSAIDLALLSKDHVACQILEQVLCEKLQTSMAIPSYTLEIEEKSDLKHKHKERLLSYESQRGLLSSVSQQELKTLDLIASSIDNLALAISKRNLVLVETEQLLQQISLKISENFSLIGVDMECYNDHKTQTTFVCLMQISTVEEDYLIDCLKLHPLINQYLQPIFEAENIMKVLHGCDGDLKWLKSNFDIDVVSLFDTSRAHMLLNNETVSLGLSALTQQFLGFELDKTYQKADWRVRPLPKAMMEYGRSDSCIMLFLWCLLSQQLRKNSDLELEMNLKMARKCWKTIEESSQKRVFVKVKFCN